MIPQEKKTENRKDNKKKGIGPAGQAASHGPRRWPAASWPSSSPATRLAQHHRLPGQNDFQEERKFIPYRTAPKNRRFHSDSLSFRHQTPGIKDQQPRTPSPPKTSNYPPPGCPLFKPKPICHRRRHCRPSEVRLAVSVHPSLHNIV